MPETQDSSKPADSKSIVERHLRLLVVASVCLIAVIAGVGLVYGDWVLVSCAIHLGSLLIVAFAAKRMLDRNRVRLAALSIGYGICFVALVLGFIAPEFSGVLALPLMVAVMFVFPHLSSAARYRAFAVIEAFAAALAHPARLFGNAGFGRGARRSLSVFQSDEGKSATRHCRQKCPFAIGTSATRRTRKIGYDTR